MWWGMRTQLIMIHPSPGAVWLECSLVLLMKNSNRISLLTLPPLSLYFYIHICMIIQQDILTQPELHYSVSFSNSQSDRRPIQQLSAKWSDIIIIQYYKVTRNYTHKWPYLDLRDQANIKYQITNHKIISSSVGWLKLSVLLFANSVMQVYEATFCFDKIVLPHRGDPGST